MILLSDGHCQRSIGAKYHYLIEHELIKDTNKTIGLYFKTQSFDDYIRISADNYTYNMSPKQASRDGLVYKINMTNKLHRRIGLDFAAEMHYNHFDGIPDGVGAGFEVIYWHTSRIGKRIAEMLCQEMNNFCRIVGLRNRGPKASNTIAYLRRTICPSIIIEPCFIDDDHHILKNKRNYENLKIALGHSLLRIKTGGIL